MILCSKICVQSLASLSPDSPICQCNLYANIAIISIFKRFLLGIILYTLVIVCIILSSHGVKWKWTKSLLNSDYRFVQNVLRDLISRLSNTFSMLFFFMHLFVRDRVSVCERKRGNWFLFIIILYIAYKINLSAKIFFFLFPSQRMVKWKTVTSFR